MSEDEKGFLARWSQRKIDAGKNEPKPVQPEATALPADAPVQTGGSEAEPPIDLESLPKLDELTASTDMTVFLRKGVPEGIRNAALRKSWALDPAIRNYVNPALDYAYDWNTPGGVPGSGELAPGTDIARMVLQVMGGGEPAAGRQQAVDKLRDTAPHPAAESSDDAAAQTRQPDPPSPSVRLSEAASTGSGLEESTSTAHVDTGAAAKDGHHDEVAAEQDERRSFASQNNPRRHGSARPQ